MINLAVQLWKEIRTRTMRHGLVQEHIRDDIRYVVVDEYQDVNPLQERLVRGLVSSARTCAWSATTTRRSTSGAAARSRTSSRSPTATTACDRSRSTTTSARARASSSSADRSPSGSQPSERLPKAMVAAGNQTWERGDLLALDFRRPGRRGGVDLRPHRGIARARLPRRPLTSSRAACRGRTSRCCSAQSPRTPARSSRSCAARHPVRHQGPEPAVRQPRDPGRRRHVPLHGRRDRRRLI